MSQDLRYWESLGGCSTVHYADDVAGDAADGLVCWKLPHGWWDIKAYDSECWYLEGQASSLNEETCDRIEPTKKEVFHSCKGHEHVTVQPQSGGEVRAVKRSVCD